MITYFYLKILMRNKKSNFIKVNGLTCEYETPMSTHNLLTYLGFNLEVVLVTCNGLLLQKEALSKRLIQPNDVLEIITLAGGG